MTYPDFLRSKIVSAPVSGFAVRPGEVNPALKPHQRDAVIWACRGGRRALFESFGLGKTVQELEFCRLVIDRGEVGKALIVLPLGVRQEFTHDAAEILGIPVPRYITATEQADEVGIYMTNYERVRDGGVDPQAFGAAVLDEAAVLRSFGSKTYQTFLPLFRGVRYKLVATATPAPNRLKELIHYAGFLEVMDTGQALTRFFQAVHRIYRFLQTEQVTIDIVITEAEQPIYDALMAKWALHNEMQARMGDIVRRYGLHHRDAIESMARSIGVKRMEIKGKHFTAVNNDCVEETAHMDDDSVDLIVTSVPFSNHYEYTPSYNDFGHNEDNQRFFEQMDFLTPSLLRVLKPGRLACVHVKDRILFGNATGTGMPTVDPFSDMCVLHYMGHGFQYMGRICVLTDVVRENNQTYRLGWSEQCKDGTKMGVGCPEYILLFRKLPSDTSKAYADEPVSKSKEEYTRGQWQLDAHAFWRSNGDRLPTKEEVMAAPVDRLQDIYRRYSRGTVYDYAEHVDMAKERDKEGHLPATFMVLSPASWSPWVWDDINRMRTLNTTQSQRRQTMHVCPLQLDIVDRLIERYSSPGELVLDPFGGLGTVALEAVKMGRRGYTIELNDGYFRDAVGYLEAAEDELDTPTLFDLLGVV